MDKKQIAITTVVGAVMFITGFLARMIFIDMKKAQSVEPIEGELQPEQISFGLQEELTAGESISVDTLKVRINDGDVQWYDGILWHTVASVEELEKEDSFVIAQANFEEFMEQLKQEKLEAQGQQEGSGGNGVDMGNEQLLIGAKETPRSTTKPQTQPSVRQPASVQTPVSQPADNLNDDSNDDSSDENSDNFFEDNSSGDNFQSNSGGEDAPADESGTGDGEDIGWSDDYL